VRFNGMSPGESLVKRDELCPSKVRNPAVYRMRPLVKSIAPSARQSDAAVGTFRRFLVTLGVPVPVAPERQTKHVEVAVIHLFAAGIS
jgi:hypothetical protein